MLAIAPHRVVALAYEGLCTFEFGCVVEVFALKRPEIEGPWYSFAVASADGRTVRAAGGVEVNVRHGLAQLDRADTIIIPGWTDPQMPPPAALLRKLRAAHARGARLASICSGVFVLAATGLLDGRSATTHWRHEPAFKARFPQVNLQLNALYVDEGQIVSSAGSAAGLDMMLHLVRRDHGTKIANLVAQRLVVPTHRTGDQAQFIPQPLALDESARVAKLMDAVRSNLAKTHTLDSMAQTISVSPRSLQRHFQQSVGHSPIEWLLRERVSLTKSLLETSQRSLAQIAERVGFGSEESLRKQFRRIAGVSPAAYRKQFGT
jgi:AraC family transcriptional regulator, transcriptional activator FtrA